ncbi:YggN family protein [uncultured Paraglaciecola sp.]|uniref:YggN family protein n=1 Tax=uncultured Paraglaciecola sp. TaxID=1765024 RepID=UPI0030DA774E|tara:strand:+ start:74347 stop:75129 length:783 start_codon:yes stop_codon:yes gene_type:complete
MRFLVLTLLLMSSIAHGGSNCEVSLNYGVVVSKQQIRVIDEGGRTVYQINHPAQLIVQGEWIDLDEQQEQELTELSNGIHQVVPKMILLANEGVELAIETIEQVYGGLVKDDKSQKKLQKSLERVQLSVKEKFVRANDNFYMGPGKLEQVNDLVDQELEEQIEEAMSTSVGGILSAIGGLVSNGEDSEEKIAAIANQLETMGEGLGQTVGPKAESLKLKAQWFCNRFKELDKSEDRLRASIKELQAYNVLETGTNAYMEQ